MLNMYHFDVSFTRLDFT